MRCRPSCAGRTARRTGSRCSRHAEGFVAERDGEIVGDRAALALGRRATPPSALVIVSPACQGRRIGQRLMSALLEGLDEHTVLLHATAEGRGLYERLGFVRTGELRQHQGIAQPAPLVALPPGWRLRPAGQHEAAGAAGARRRRRAACRAMR